MSRLRLLSIKPYIDPENFPSLTSSSISNVGLAYQQSPSSIQKVFSPRARRKKPSSPQKVPQLQ